jgi:hypothetical protein
MKKFFIVHPFLFALFNILFLFSHNIEQVSKFEFLLPSAITLGITLILVLLSILIFNDYNKAAIIISFFIILFFSYGRVYDLIMDQSLGKFEIGRHRYLLFIWGLVFTYSTFLIIRMRRKLHNLTSILNITAISLVAISLYNISAYQFKLKNIRQDDSKSMECLDVTLAGSENISEFRDIYYIILDGYASANTLTDVYNYDNKHFTDYLKSKGFYIASKSQSNYPWTFLSLASSLNLEYINYLTEEIDVGSRGQTIPIQMITNNEVINFLKLKGYKFINFSSGWDKTEYNIHADLNIRSEKAKEFLTVLIQTTMLRPIERPFSKNLRKSRLNTFSKLAKSYRVNGPKFVFAHIIAPHPPYLFGKNGEPVPGAKLTLSGDLFRKKKDYINQLIFTNKQIKKIISEILTKSKVSPIIILQADHGTASTFPLDIFFPNAGLGGSPTRTMLKERFGIFNAYYLPVGGNDLLYESISPVNTFRLIFDFYYGTNCGLLDDESYYSIYDLPYEFINVTDKVKYD